jgi:hypothetical protein
MSQPTPPRILIVGAAYSGLYAALNVLNVCEGKPHFPSILKLKEARVPDVIPHITILDERDGVCRDPYTDGLAWIRPQYR